MQTYNRRLVQISLSPADVELWDKFKDQLERKMHGEEQTPTKLVRYLLRHVPAIEPVEKTA